MENGEMKDRIAHIIRAKNLTAAEFAVRLGIQPSNVSHLLSGRNNPSLDFVKKLKETFPEYNLDWIIMGVGPMTVSEPFLPPMPPASPHEAESVHEKVAVTEPSLDVLEPESRPEAAPAHSTALPKGIILLFDDDTYKILSPR
jgi:transcriptional regulator with XRE-family HTH domain